MTDVYNVTMQALHQVSLAYAFIQGQLEQANITLPPADQLFSKLSGILSFIMTHSPTVVQKFYVLLDQLPLKETGFIPIFLGLVLLYITYCTVVASLRWFYRMIYGFIRFSLIVGIIASCVYIAQQKMMEKALFPGSSTADDSSRTHNTI